MKTFRLTANLRDDCALYHVVARTRADAILQAQKMMAEEFGLNRTEEALVRVEFEQESAA